MADKISLSQRAREIAAHWQHVYAPSTMHHETVAVIPNELRNLLIDMADRIEALEQGPAK